MSLIKIIPTTSSLPCYHKPAAGRTKSSHIVHVHGRRSTLAALTTTDFHYYNNYYSDLLLIRRRSFKCNKRRSTRTGIMCILDDESGDPEGGLEEDDKLQEISSATESTSIGNELFTAPRKNKHILNDLSDIITHGCKCLYNFLFNENGQALRVMEIMSSNIKRNLGSKVQIHVQTSSLLPEYGISIAVTWTLEWKENSVPLMKGMSLYTCHVYPSKLVITRNVNADEMITQPIWLLLLLLKPIIKQRMVDYAMGSKAPSLVYILLAVTTTSLLLLLLVSYVFF